MKFTTIVVAFGAALAITTSGAKADTLTTSSSDYIGQIDDGIPSGLSDEIGYVNDLISLTPGTTGDTIGSETYNRSSNTFSTLPTATSATQTTTSCSANPCTDATNINVTGYTYILGKYDASKAGSFVWDIAGLTTVTLPGLEGTCGNSGCGLSHYTLFKPSTPVPDGGTTLMLLGGVIVGLESLRRKLRA